MELAIFGKVPRFEKSLHVGKPNIGNREKFLERMNEILDSGWLTNHGPFVSEFEKRIADFTGVRNCIAICNGTIALEIATRALELKGEVIVPSFTFIATVHALQWQEITPVFVDIDPHTYNIQADMIEQMITPKTTGIIGVHLWGRPCDTDAIEEIAKRRNLKVIYDASHAFGVTKNGKMIGNFGDAETFSFHATKFMNTFEGGAITTNNDELAAKIRLMKNFGFSGLDNVIYIGTNGKMTEVSAAMGLTSMENMKDFIEVNKMNYYSYRDKLSKVPGITMIEYDESEECNYQYVVIEVDKNKAKLSRDELMAILHAENILARRYFFPGCHKMEPYRSYYPHAGYLLPVSEMKSQMVMSLPTGVAVSEEDIEKVCDIIDYSVRNGEAISSMLKELESGLKFTVPLSDTR
ncbi:MAG: aminotransferase class I/II-fold pyridoxal phosphate-dependent enzyme [Ignavibacteriae bacterium]|nr:aminotransferase class I/II-fold pyridoxal phosphate-dependent enzyme [Ignavibacteriota bacterium]